MGERASAVQQGANEKEEEEDKCHALDCVSQRPLSSSLSSSFVVYAVEAAVAPLLRLATLLYRGLRVGEDREQEQQEKEEEDEDEDEDEDVEENNSRAQRRLTEEERY